MLFNNSNKIIKVIIIISGISVCVSAYVSVSVRVHI